jgi:hypothetical protein
MLLDTDQTRHDWRKAARGAVKAAGAATRSPRLGNTGAQITNARRCFLQPSRLMVAGLALFVMPS